MKKLVLFSPLFVLFVCFLPQAQGGGCLSCCCDDRPSSGVTTKRISEVDPLLSPGPSTLSAQPIFGLEAVSFPPSLPSLQKLADESQVSFSALIDFIVYPNSGVAASSTIKYFSEIQGSPCSPNLEDFSKQVTLFCEFLGSKGRQISQTQQSKDIIKMIEEHLLTKYLFVDGHSFIFKSEEAYGTVISRRMGLKTLTGPVVVIQVPGDAEQ